MWTPDSPGLTGQRVSKLSRITASLFGFMAKFPPTCHLYFLNSCQPPANCLPCTPASLRASPAGHLAASRATSWRHPHPYLVVSPDPLHPRPLLTRVQDLRLGPASRGCSQDPPYCIPVARSSLCWHSPLLRAHSVPAPFQAIHADRPGDPRTNSDTVTIIFSCSR